MSVLDLLNQWNVFCLNKCAAGDTSSTRDGRKIVVKSVQLRGGLHPTDTSTLDHSVRIILFVDKQNNNNDPVGAAAAATTEMGLVLASNTETISMLNSTTAGRFQIIKDWTLFIPGYAAGTGVSNPKSWKDFKYFKKLELPTHYSGTTDSAGVINDNALYIAMYSDAATGTGSRIDMEARVRFLDV